MRALQEITPLVKYHLINILDFTQKKIKNNQVKKYF